MSNQSDFTKLLQYGIDNKPEVLIISDLKWKYLVRCVLRGENILMVGPTGCGKTMAAKLVSNLFVEEKEEILTKEELNILKLDPNIKIEKVENI